MTYWHMQIKHFDILEENKETFLKLNDVEENKKLFHIINSEVKRDDLILIKDRNKPKYLLQVIEVIKTNKIKIKIFDLNTKILDNYPLGSINTEMKKIQNTQLPAYKYIKKLYEGNIKELISDIKLDELYIKNSKMFEDFLIDFKDNNKNPLPIVIIAGVNGIGKTSLLEIIFNFKTHYRHLLDDDSYLKVKYKNNEIKINRSYIKDYELIKNQNEEKVNRQFKQGNEIAISFLPNKFNGFTFLEKNIIYIEALDNNMDDIKKYILSYYRKESRRLDSYTRALKKIKSYINEIFVSIDLNFELFDINDTDRDNEKVTFKNRIGKEFDIDCLSTGEKTLLSKVLYLYFRDVKNQIILIDEPELSLHPAWQNRVLKLYENFAEKNNCQIIIATHSPHIIGSAKSEYVRLLTKDGVVDNFSHTYGAKFSQILTDIMGVRDLRTPEINDKFVAIKDMIVENKFDTQEFKEKWQELENILGKNYFDLKLLKLEIASRRKDVQNR